ncbi:MAG: pyridoxal-phosphate dependent enzyme [Myxococcales bacterium]|nr:pyridoxal-phosphate dependent enzyme [Myxococcales bacterium]
MADHQRRVYEDIMGLTSNEENPTPIVRLNKVVPFTHTKVYAKLEWYNPFGAVKDRVAYNMIRDAEEKNLLSRGQKLVEPTSGNTGMGLAMVSNQRGYALTTPLSRMIPLEKRTMLRFFGSTVLELDDNLCPAPGAPEGAIAKARELAATPTYHMLDQYKNLANPEAHYRTTGPEIWRQTQGEITHFVAGLGTCGTITGTGRYLKEQNPGVKVLGVHPVEGHDIPGVRSIKQLEQTALFKPEEYDGLVAVDNQEAFDLCLRLNREESIIAGPSSAMALAGAFKLIPDEPGLIVVVIFPDNAFKYCSSIVRHIPQLALVPEKSQKERSLETMVSNVLKTPGLHLDADEAIELHENHEAAFVDVRDFATYRREHIPDAISAPLDEINDYAPLLPEDKKTPIVCVCNRGVMSLTGVLHLKSMGYENVKSLDGGMIDWRRRGLPVESD